MPGNFPAAIALLTNVASASSLHDNSTAANEATELCLIVRLRLHLLCADFCSTMTNEYGFSLLLLALGTTRRRHGVHCKSDQQVLSRGNMCEPEDRSVVPSNINTLHLSSAIDLAYSYIVIEIPPIDNKRY